VLVVRSIITLLCAAGLYASVFMQRKSVRAAHGEVPGPSVVKLRRAKLFGGIPNSALGIVYYVALPALVWSTSSLVALSLALAAAVTAAGTSLYLAYSLLFITRRECPYCWTAHAANWSLAACVAVLFFVR